LINNIKTDRATPIETLVNVGRERRCQVHVQFVNIGVEDFIHETNARRFERILVREFNMDLPDTTLERC